MTGTEALAAIFVPYGQGRGRGLDEMELGAHGVELDRLVSLGLPVVPGLTWRARLLTCSSRWSAGASATQSTRC